jgi:hypothetical protein
VSEAWENIVRTRDARIRELEAANATLTAERDARVVLPEIANDQAVTVKMKYDRAFAELLGIDGDWDYLIRGADGPTPAAALEALDKKIKEKNDAH